MKKFNRNDYFILYANCLPVKGASRSIICDLQKRKYYFIPNDLSDILNDLKKHTVSYIYNKYGIDNHEVIEEYLAFLLEYDLGFFDAELDLFPSLGLEWDMPSEVTNSIIDVEEKKLTKTDYKNVFWELSDLNCVCVQIRSFTAISGSSIEKLLDYTIDSRLNEIRFVLPYHEELEKLFVDKLLTKHKRISEVMFFGSRNDKIKNVLGVRLIYISNQITLQSCGSICLGQFSITIPHITESLNFNSCLNKKISIDIEGNIKNCPSQKESFGNIRDINFRETLANNEFTKLWKVKKDDINICKDCEFRYICTDCRIHIEEENNIYSKPSKCTYDPYTTTWH